MSPPLVPKLGSSDPPVFSDPFQWVYFPGYAVLVTSALARPAAFPLLDKEFWPKIKVLNSKPITRPLSPSLMLSLTCP